MKSASIREENFTADDKCYFIQAPGDGMRSNTRAGRLLKVEVETGGRVVAGGKYTGLRWTGLKLRVMAKAALFADDCDTDTITELGNFLREAESRAI